MQVRFVPFVSKAQMALVLLAGSTGAVFAQSSSYDVTSVTAQITAAVTAILAIGAAVVAGPRIAIKVWKWIARAL